MIGVGIGYITIGLVPFFVNKLNGHLPKNAITLYTYMRYCGIAILLLYGITSLFAIDPSYRSAIAVIPVILTVPMIVRQATHIMYKP